MFDYLCFATATYKSITFTQIEKEPYFLILQVSQSYYIINYQYNHVIFEYLLTLTRIQKRTNNLLLKESRHYVS